MPKGAKGTHIVLLPGGHGIDEIVLVHERIAILVLLRMEQEVGSGLVRQLWRLCAADQLLLEILLDACHCITVPVG